MHNSVLAVISQKLKMAETHDQHEDKGPFLWQKQTENKQANETKLLPQIFCHIKNVGSSNRKFFGHNKRQKFFFMFIIFGPVFTHILLFLFFLFFRQKACKVVQERKFLRIAGTQFD